MGTGKSKKQVEYVPDMKCAECGYPVKSSDRLLNCPECGTPIAFSLKHYENRTFSNKWIKLAFYVCLCITLLAFIFESQIYICALSEVTMGSRESMKLKHYLLPLVDVGVILGALVTLPNLYLCSSGKVAGKGWMLFTANVLVFLQFFLLPSQGG